jgi:predicted metalloprotease with PDZ domain
MTRPLIDTTIAAQLLYNAPEEWTSIRRSVDFYDEGWLIWLDVDSKIRELTNGAKTLDDFCKRFHGAPSTPPMVKPYTFDDVVTTLNDVAPFDWRDFLQTRLNSTDGPRAAGRHRTGRLEIGVSNDAECLFAGLGISAPGDGTRLFDWPATGL